MSIKKVPQDRTSLLSLVVVGAALVAFALLPVMIGFANAEKMYGGKDNNNDYDSHHTHKPKFQWCYNWDWKDHHWIKHWYKDYPPFESWYECYPPYPHFDHHPSYPYHTGSKDSSKDYNDNSADRQ